MWGYEGIQQQVHPHSLYDSRRPCPSAHDMTWHPCDGALSHGRHGMHLRPPSRLGHHLPHHHRNSQTTHSSQETRRYSCWGAVEGRTYTDTFIDRLTPPCVTHLPDAVESIVDVGPRHHQARHRTDRLALIRPCNTTAQTKPDLRSLVQLQGRTPPIDLRPSHLPDRSPHTHPCRPCSCPACPPTHLRSRRCAAP